MVAQRDERIVSIEEAVSVVKDGDVVGLSGSVLFNQPSALARAVIRKVKSSEEVSGVRD